MAPSLIIRPLIIIVGALRQQKMEDVFLKAIPRSGLKASTTGKTLKLKKYEIKSAN